MLTYILAIALIIAPPIAGPRLVDYLLGRFERPPFMGVAP